MKKWNIGWGTVSNCNMKCQFCYSHFKRQNSYDLGFDDWINFIDHNNMFINTINYGTGENSMSEDWFRLIEYIRNNYPHIRQAVTTNGYIIEQIQNSSQKMDIVMKAIDEMDISLDYCDERKHNEFRGQKNAYKWAINTLEFCSKYNKRPTIVCLGSDVNINFENIDGIFKIAKKYGALVRINLYRPTEGINDFSKRFILSPEKLVNLLRYIDKTQTILSISDALYSNLLTECVEEDPSGIDSLRILSDGTITPSTYLITDDYIVGNIKDEKILEKLCNEKIIENIIQETIPDECEGCIYRDSCKGGVYDRRLLWNGTLAKKDPYCTYIPGRETWEKLTVATKEFQSVHHGYLPTMFFEPKYGEGEL